MHEQILSISPRNTVGDHATLFKSTNCKVLLTPSPARSPIVAAIQDALPLQLLDSPSVQDLLNNYHPHYSFPKNFATAKDEPLVVLHTSGTTGVPKPIVYTHAFAASCIQWGQLKAPEGFESQFSLLQSNRQFITLPFFHVRPVLVKNLALPAKLLHKVIS